MKGDGGVKSEGSSIISRCVLGVWSGCQLAPWLFDIRMLSPSVFASVLSTCMPVRVPVEHSYRILGFPRAVGGYTGTVPSGQSCGLVLPFGEPRCMGGVAARSGIATANTTTAEAVLTPTMAITTGAVQRVLFVPSSLRCQIDNDPCVCVCKCLCPYSFSFTFCLYHILF